MSTAQLLWLDLETTGTEPGLDAIIEVGAILTDHNLIELDTFTTLVKPTPEGMGRLIETEPVLKMHRHNGLFTALVDRNTELPTPDDVAVNLVEWAVGWGAQDGELTLAGSGVGHFDMRFLRAQMPAVLDLCSYAPLDVGVLRRAHRMWVGTHLSAANSEKTHRALDDARCHLAEGRAFRELFTGALPAAA